MLAAKPAYREPDLNAMLGSELRARVGRISNQQARHIAVGLWQILEGQVTSGRSSPPQLPDNWSLHQLAIGGGTQLLLLLDKLQSVDFGDMVVMGPEYMDGFLDKMHPFYRLIVSPPPVKSSFDIAKRLYDYMEFYTNPGQSFPQEFLNKIHIVLLYAFTALAGLAERMFNTNGDIDSVLLYGFLLAAGLMLLLSHFHSRMRRVRIIALYISFTDEFIDDERQYDDPAIVDTGW
ncbi:MAG: hypothetical protein R3F46_12290 [bacterium]|nr:hypothetical protein [bacterium]